MFGQGAGPPGEILGPVTIDARSPWSIAWRQLRRDRVAIAGAVVIVLAFNMFGDGVRDCLDPRSVT